MAWMILLAAWGVLLWQSRTDELQLGVNGHPFVQEGYRDIPIETQLDWVRRLGAGWYRSDWGGWASHPEGLEKLDRLVEGARAKGIRVLPVLFPPVDLREEADEDRIYRASFDYARVVVGHFRGELKHWELSNELDLFCMVRQGEQTIIGHPWEGGDPDGDQPEHYHQERYQRARALLRGLADGVRIADPEAVRLIDTGGWLHYGFIQRLVDDQVPFDALAWHWYSEMGDITRVRGEFNLLERLLEFGKPIWITEWNRRHGSLGEDGETAQATYLREGLVHWQELARRYPIEAVFVYELFDEPYFGPANPESHYGLVRLRKGTLGCWTTAQPKAAFEVVRAMGMRKEKVEPSLNGG